MTISDIAFEARESIIQALGQEQYKDITPELATMISQLTDQLQLVYNELDSISMIPPRVLSEAGKALYELRNNLPITSPDFIEKGKLNDDKLFNNLTEREKFYFSVPDEVNSDCRLLYIYSNIYAYVPTLKVWLLIHRYNTFNSEMSWSPEYIEYTIGEDVYLINTESLYVYKQVENNQEVTSNG